MGFAQKIESLRNKAQETQAANKIIDMLKLLESKNDVNTSFRWIWELIQNAKDVTNSSGKVDILINFDEMEKVIEFRHNGRLFTTKNIVFLIEQVSTKERGKLESNAKKTTGKFGTGFLTTHLLSKKVSVSGYLQDEGDKPYLFEIELDRSSSEQMEIIDSITESCNQLDRNSKEATNNVDENNFNTCFTYHLDSSGINIAKKGLNNLIVSAPYVFSFIPELNTISIFAQLHDRNYNQKIVRDETLNANLDNGEVTSISITTNGKNEKKYIFKLNEFPSSNLAIAAEVDKNNGSISIKPFHADLPKLFCDFPLLGTNDFSFPVVINSTSFNPTEQRNGIFLTCNEVDGDESSDITENKENMINAVMLYNKLLDYFLSNRYNGIYNITKIADQPFKDWLTEEWLNDYIISKIKEHMQEVELIETHGGTKNKLQETWEENHVLIPNHSDANIRSKLWELSSKLCPNRLPKKDELEFWYNSLWSDCKNYCVEDLIKQIEDFDSLSSLKTALNCDVYSWLNEFYSLVFAKEYVFAKNTGTPPNIIPNQNGNFCTVGALFIDANIEEKYKEIALVIDLDIKNKLIDNAVVTVLSRNVEIQKYTFENMIYDFQNELKTNCSHIKDFYKKIVCLKSGQRDNQNTFLRLAKIIFFEDDLSTVKVNKSSDELFESALTYLMEKICDHICECGSIANLTNNYDFNNKNEAKTWLSDYIGFVLKLKKHSLYTGKCLFPNQNGILKEASELSMDSGDIAEIVKDISAIAGEDIRNTLLHKNMAVMLKNRTIENEQLATRITNYIKVHKNKLGNDPQEKTLFRNFYNYLVENNNEKSKISTIFSELCTNLHWFYNDDDIAENMKKVEEFSNVLTKYNVADIKELEKILSAKTENIEISKELLAQWGISTEDELQKILASKMLDANFIMPPHQSAVTMFNYVKDILERAKNNVLRHLSSLNEYDTTNVCSLTNTIFLVKKNDEEIYIIARPSDYKQVIIYYDSEIDTLDYERDCELWVEDGKNKPEKITLGKIIRLTGVNKIPLRRLG